MSQPQEQTTAPCSTVACTHQETLSRMTVAYLDQMTKIKDLEERLQARTAKDDDDESAIPTRHQLSQQLRDSKKKVENQSKSLQQYQVSVDNLKKQLSAISMSKERNPRKPTAAMKSLQTTITNQRKQLAALNITKNQSDTRASKEIDLKDTVARLRYERDSALHRVEHNSASEQSAITRAQRYKEYSIKLLSYVQAYETSLADVNNILTYIKTLLQDGPLDSASARTNLIATTLDVIQILERTAQLTRPIINRQSSPVRTEGLKRKREHSRTPDDNEEQQKAGGDITEPGLDEHIEKLSNPEIDMDLEPGRL